MALSKAIHFVKEAGNNMELRSRCYKYSSRHELLKFLDFNDAEFEDAINSELVKCQTYEQAEEVQQIKMWFMLLISD